MSILYISRESVCLSNDSASKIYYYAEKFSVDYKKIKNYISTICKNGKLIVVIGSFYTNIDFIQKKNDKVNFLDLLRLKLDNKDVVCGNISLLNKEQTEAVVTTIRSNAQENHILKIIEMLQQYNIDLKYIYCLEQLPLLYGLTSNINPYSKNYVPELDVVVVLFDEKFFLSVANGKDFILGREIIIEPNVDIVASVANALSMVIKNIEITYTSIHSKSKIKIFGFTNSIDIDGLRSKDAILGNIDISYNELPIGGINIDVLPNGLMYELLLIKIALPRLKFLQPLTSGKIKKHTQMFSIIRYVKLIFFLSCIAIGCLFAYYIISISVLEVERQLKRSNVAKEKQKLQKYQEDNKKITKDVVDVAVMKMQQLKLEDSYNEPLTAIAKITNDKKSLLDVQGYQFDCLNSTKQDKIFFISFEIEMFNKGKSHKYTQTVINQLITDVSDELKKKYNKVSVFDEKMPKVGIKELSVEDFFDTIYVVCTNDVNYNLPIDDKQFKDFLLNGKKTS